MSQTIAEWYWAEGRAEGPAEGRAEGELGAYRQVLLSLLEQRFGALPQRLVQRIEAANDFARLQDCIGQILHIASLDELQL